MTKIVNHANCLNMKLVQKIARELNQPEMLKQLGMTMLALSVAVLILRPLAFPHEPYLWGGDFNTFWAASWLAQHGGVDRLYGTNMLSSIPGLAVPAPPWFYPPPMLLLAWPAALLPFPAAYAAFAAFSLLLGVAVWKFWKLDRLHLILLLASPVLLLNLLYGQNGFITAALWTGGLLLLEKKPFVAGSLFGLLIIKPQLAVLAPLVLLADRQWRALAGMIFSALLLAEISWFVFGPDVWLDFIRNSAAIGDLLKTGVIVDVNKIGSIYIASRMSGAGHGEALLMQAMIAFTALALCLNLWVRKDVPFGHKAAAVLIATLLITPYQFIYDLTLLLGAIVFWHQASGPLWRSEERFCAWLLWLAPLLSQGFASTLYIGCLPPILLLSLWQLTKAPRMQPASLHPQ